MKNKLTLILFLICICSQKTIQNSTEVFSDIKSLTDIESENDSNLTVSYDLFPTDESTEEPDSTSGDEDQSEESADDINSDESVVEEKPFKEPQNASEFIDYFEDLKQRTREKLEDLFDQYMPQLIQMSSTVTLSPKCTMDAVRILLGLRKLQPWAIKILDSSGKVPDGILGGTLTALGSYDDCLESRIGDEQNDENTRGQYCAINVKPYLPPKPPLNTMEKVFNDAADAKGFAKDHHFARIAPIFYFVKLRLGICLPSSCTLNDLHLITQRISHRFRVNVTVQSCDKKEPFNISNEQIIPLSIITVLLGLIGMATVIDVIGRAKEHVSGFIMKCWLSFSICTNREALLSSRESSNIIKPLNGMKVLSLIWIMIAHTYMTLDYRATGRAVTTRQLPKGFLFQIVLNSSLAIETFFFLSGLLVTYTTLNKMKSSSEWKLRQWIAYYIHRYIRLTPAIMLLIVLFLLAYRWGNGPLWQELIYPAVDNCRNNWWTHALYVSNLIKSKDMCFLHLWYIAADMQLFIFTPIFLILMRRNPYLSKVLLILTIGTSIIGTGIVTYLQDLPPTLLFNNPDPSARRLYGNVLFVKAFPHAAPYMVGMLTGYLLVKYSHINIRKRVVIFGWFGSISMIIFILFSTWNWNRGQTSPSQMVSIVYASSFRVLWALSMSWIAIACRNGRGGIINSFLSLPIFSTLSSLTYVAYLIHPGMMYVFIASTRNVFAFTHYFVLQLFFSHLTTTFIFSYIFSLLIEYPFLSLERVLHTYITSDKYRPKIKLYSVNSVDSTASLKELQNHESTDSIEKYKNLRPFAQFSDLDYTFNRTDVKQNSCETNKFVFKL